MPQNRKAMIAATPRFVSAAPLVFGMSSEPESPQFPEDWVSDDHLEARAELEWRSPPSLAGRVRYPSKCESSSSEAFPDTPSFASISDSPNTPVFDELESDHSLDRQQPRLIDEICSVSSDACSAPSVFSPGRVVRPRRNATPTNWYVAVRRLSEGPEEKGSVAFVPSVEASSVTVASDKERQLCFWDASALASTVK